MLERKILHEYFPLCTLRLCLFHVLKRIYGQITVIMSGKSSECKKQQKLLINNIIFSKNLQEFENNYGLLEENIKLYFDKNWLKYKNEFIELLYSNEIDFESRTNNRSEGFNSGLKKYFVGKRELEILFVELIEYIESTRFEKHSTLVRKYTQDIQLGTDQPLLKILAYLLTEYAYNVFQRSKCENTAYISECRVYKRYGLLCINCTKENGITLDRYLVYCKKRWLKQEMVNIIDFKGMGIDRKCFIEQRKYIYERNFNNYDFNNYIPTWNENTPNPTLTGENVQVLNMKETSKKQEKNNVAIFIKQLGYLIKNDRKVNNKNKRIFLEELIVRCKNGQYNFNTAN
eukprot:GAHX01001606.1.p1 GENE.GAHX01001606.1~~GAHX01001606.1.p1  ORF type:complete len:345 (+),score=41.72 GAHX01001606.1:883-1917(+)